MKALENASWFLAENRELYQGMALSIKPALNDSHQVKARVAFAILSANIGFDEAVKALAYCASTGWKPDPETLIGYGMVPMKAEAIERLRYRDYRTFLKREGEGWHEYRIRLKRSTLGLGLAKASFAAALLYPDEADVACIDTWMQKILLGRPSFKTIGIKAYSAAEEQVRQIARKEGVCTFVAQWAMWDSARGRIEDHSIFPGSHKKGE